MSIDERERNELLARWHRRHSETTAGGPLEQPVAELIDEACRTIGHERINVERCGTAGDAVGQIWQRYELDPVALVDELAAIRRSIWEIAAARLRSETASAERLLEARDSIDRVFDLALRRAVGAVIDAPRRTADVFDQPAGPDDENRPARANFHVALDEALASSAARRSPLALVVLHVEVDPGSFDPNGPDSTLVDVSQVLSGHMRRKDRGFQLSDSDHAVICPDTTADGARHLLNRVECAMALYGRQTGLNVTLTGGLSVFPSDGATSVDLIRVALADREFSLPGGFDAARV